MDEDQGSDEDLVTEEIATHYHDAFVAFQDSQGPWLRPRGAEETGGGKTLRSQSSKLLFRLQTEGGGSLAGKPDGQAKSVQLCQVAQVFMTEVASSGSASFLQAIADTACSRTVAGHDLFEK